MPRTLPVKVYGLKGGIRFHEAFDFSLSVYPLFAEYPASADLYDDAFQMSVEECGNLLIMTAAVVQKEESIAFAKPHMEVLQGWAAYLTKYGLDPGNQPCTDDFVGHLAHNANWAVRAVMGVEAYALPCSFDGKAEDARRYHALTVRDGEREVHQFHHQKRAGRNLYAAVGGVWVVRGLIEKRKFRERFCKEGYESFGFDAADSVHRCWSTVSLFFQDEGVDGNGKRVVYCY